MRGMDGMGLLRAAHLKGNAMVHAVRDQRAVRRDMQLAQLVPRLLQIPIAEFMPLPIIATLCRIASPILSDVQRRMLLAVRRGD